MNNYMAQKTYIGQINLQTYIFNKVNSSTESVLFLLKIDTC